MTQTIHAGAASSAHPSSEPRLPNWGNAFSGADVTIEPQEILEDLTYGRE